MKEKMKTSVKDVVLDVLENHRGEYISGGDLAKQLEVSRNAVWKAMKSLKKEGYAIDAVKNRGYRLAESNDILSEQSIQKYMNQLCDVFKIEVFKSVHSTNELLKERAFGGAEEGTVLIAEEQTNGKGQLGKTFYSPMGTGIYMSVLLRPKTNLENALFITTSAAVAVAQAIEGVSDKKAEIKWVNDIYCNGKKVCGILTEAAFNIETSGFDYVVLGIGVNVRNPEDGFPGELTDIADSIFLEPDTDVRSQLVAEVLMHFWNYYKNLEKKEFVKEYKSRSCLIGKQIIIEAKEEKKEAVVLSINDQCHLLVKMADGSVEELCAGTIRLKKDSTA